MPTKKAAKRTIPILVIGLVFAISTAFAIATCGPGFHNKQEAVSFFKSNPAAADALAKEVAKRKAYNFHADQDIIAWLEQPSVKAFKAPQGYVLTHNTYCPNGPGSYFNYSGLLNNMGGKLMLWYGNKNGEYFPILKGYCLNAVFGPPVIKKPPTKKPPCGCHHHPPKCHKHHKCGRKPKPKCSTKSPGGGGGNCVSQPVTVTPTSTCENGTSGNNNCPQTTITIVNNCGNVNYGESTNVNQGGNCNNGGTETCVGVSNCNEENTCVNNSCNEEKEEPCGCKSEPTIKITGKTELNMIPAGKTSGDFNITTYASESGGTLMVDAGIGSVSSCNSETPEDTLTTSVSSGASKACVIFYAPEDADHPEYMTVTMTACIGSVCDKVTQTFKLTYPERP